MSITLQQFEVMYESITLFFFTANVARIMKKAIPSQGKIAKDARECVQECVSEFISFITSEASDRCQVCKTHTQKNYIPGFLST